MSPLRLYGRNPVFNVSISQFPIPHPAPHPEWTAKLPSEPFRPATNGVVLTRPLKPSHVTGQKTPEFETETFDAPINLPYDYEIKKTAAEADKELKELFEGAMQDGPAEIDMSEAIVDGFADGITLKPHQVRSGSSSSSISLTLCPIPIR